MNITKEHRSTLRTFQAVTPSGVRARMLSMAGSSTARGLRGLVRGLKNVSLFLLDSNVKRRGVRLGPSVRLRAINAGMRKFAQVIATTFRCFRLRDKKRLTIVDSVTKAGKLKITPTCSTAGQFRGACVSTLRRLTRVRGLGVHFASVHPKFMSASLLGSNGECPLLVGPEGMTARVVQTLGHGRQIMIIS